MEGLEGLVEQVQLCGAEQCQGVQEGGPGRQQQTQKLCLWWFRNTPSRGFSLSVVLKQDPCISAILSPPSPP